MNSNSAKVKQSETVQSHNSKKRMKKK